MDGEYLPKASHIAGAYRNGLTLFVYYGLRFTLIAAATAFAYEGDWETALGTVLVFVLMLAPSVLKQRYRLYLPFALDLGIVIFIFATFFLGHILHFYELFPLWDKFLHFQSGLVLSVTGFVLVYTLNKHQNVHLGLSPGFVALFAIVFSMAIGVTWEIAEFVGDFATGGQWQGVITSNADTMWDLIADTGGALLVSTVGYVWMLYHERLPFTPWLFKILKKR